MPDELARRQAVEIDFWRTSATERPGSDAVENIVNKAADAAVFLDLLTRYGHVFGGAARIMELGGGQGWASCLVKRRHPSAVVVTTDISPHAVASVRKWERVFDTQLDGARACRSYELGVADGSLDLIFCFAAAHHFAAHRRTLAEVRRVLRPGGHCLYLYEPSCAAALHAAARWRVNRKRPQVPEDVLVSARIRRLAREAGLDCRVEFYPSVARRGPLETVYYAALTALPPLQRLLPCTANYLFTRA